VCRALVELGHEVRVVSPRSLLERPRRGASAEPRLLPGLSDLNVEYPTYLYPPRVLRTLYDWFMWTSTRDVARRVARELRPHLILSYWAHPDGAVAARIAREVGIPSAVIVGGSDVLILTRRAGATRRRSVVRALHACDAVISVGRELAAAVESLGVPPQKVHVVYQGVDRKIFSPGSLNDARQRLGIPRDAQVLTCVGSLIPVKGIDILLHAVAMLHRRRDALRLYLVGEGASRGALEAQAARLGIDDIVRSVGRVEQSRLPDWYRAADLTVLASRSEGVPNVLRESLACGTPFVATRVGGIHEIDLGGANRLVEPGDPVALADAIDAALDAARRPEATGAMTWTESTRQLLDILTPLVARSGRARDARRLTLSEGWCVS
jgi:glycosyltransferase involved in cell wall biosynthesis